MTDLFARTKPKTFDSKTRELAEHFLGDDFPAETDALARDIQQFIEDWLDYEHPKWKGQEEEEDPIE